MSRRRRGRSPFGWLYRADAWGIGLFVGLPYLFTRGAIRHARRSTRRAAR